MPERTTITQIVNIGVEAIGSEGTVVPANRRLQSVGIDPSISAEVNIFRPSGSKFPTVQALNQEWVEAGVEGQPTYEEMTYLLASVLTNPTTTTDVAGVAFTHSFAPAQATADTPRTFTVEKGSAVRAHRFSYGLLTDLSVSFGRDEVTLDGTMIGRRIEDGVALTANPTTLAMTPVLPTQVSVYLDDAAANLGTTKLTRVISVDLEISDRYNPAWFLDAAVNSWAVHVESEPTVTATITMEADAAGMALLTQMRDGASRFLRVQAVGPVLSGAFTNLLRFDVAGKVEDVGDFGDEDGVYTVEWTLRSVYDGTWGNALRATLGNSLAAL